ncbi:MAG: LssY C-terminal domain-containing protein [bacterium]
MTAAVAAAFPLLRAALSDWQSREMLLMSALGVAFVLVLFLTWAHEGITKVGRVPRTRIVRSAMTFGASCVAVGIFLVGAQADPVHALTKVAHLPRALWPLHHGAERSAIHHDHVGLLPRFSAKLSGASQAPVSLVFLGSGADLLEAFASAGWHVADRVTPRTAVRAFTRGVLNRPYASAPVLPVFLDGKLHDLAFQKHDDAGTSRCRHHARWWLTDFTCDGKQVWVATASFDAGVGIGRLFPLPIHHIHPDIDAERDYVVRSVTGTGRVEVTQHVRVTEPMTGKNAAGDRFFTQGTALVLA